MSAPGRQFRSEAGQKAYFEAYEASLSLWEGEWETRDVETSHGVTHVRIGGRVDGPPLVLFHGLNISSTFWACNTPAWTPHFRIYAVDTIGDFGRSKLLKKLKGPDDCALWVGELLDALGLEETSMMGMSYGGWIATNFATHSPKRVHKLIQMAPAYTYQPLSWEFIFRAIPMAVLRTYGWTRRFMYWATVDVYEQDPQAKVYYDAVVDQMAAGQKHLRPQFPMMAHVFSKEQLARLSMPVLLLVGEQEKIYNPHKAIAYAKAHVPDFRAKLLSPASHDISIVQREAVNQAVLSFLK